MADELEIIQRFLNGDRSAFDQLVITHQENVRQFMYRATGNIEDANDLAQDVFIKVYKNLHRFHGKSEFKTWLYRICANTFNTHYRKLQIRDFLTVDPPQEMPAEPTDENSMRQLQLVLGAMNKLSTQQRKIVLLRSFQGLSVANTAEILETTENVVKVGFHNALAKLKKVIKDD